ncbi:MAG: insulinase family protein [Symbiobacteriaceae bacterium]|nr:insulinase family protein [Symbiobacteriaceae bacterium]
MPSGTKVLLLPDERFASLQIRLWFDSPLESRMITPAALLPRILKRGSAVNPSQQEIVIALEELWGADINTRVSKYGTTHTSAYDLDLVDPRFLPDEVALLRPGMRLLAELVYDPFLPDGGFSPSFFREEQQILLSTLERIKTHQRSAYAHLRCLASLFQGEAFAIHHLGIPEELRELEPTGLLSYYRSFRQSAALSIGVCGAFDSLSMLENLSECFPQVSPPPALTSPVPVESVASPSQIREELPGEQSHLVMAFSSGLAYSHELSLPLSVVNGLWGAYAHSRLFRYLREEAGLAYAVYSQLDRQWGVLFVTASISAEDAPQAEEIILDHLASLKRGEITEEEWQMTLATLRDTYLQMSDEPYSLLSFAHYSQLSRSSLSLPEVMAALQKVTKEQVIAAANCLQLHISYLLAGNEDSIAEGASNE